jgi:hypothetical protein
VEVFDQLPQELRGIAPGVAGSALALFFLRRPPTSLIGMFLGGCLLSFFGTSWAARASGMEAANGLVGFLLGLFGMALIAKLHDTIEAISPTELWNALRKKVGLE